MSELTENGALIPNLKFADGDYLYNAISGKFTVLALTEHGQLPAQLQPEIQALKAQGVPVQIIALAQDGVTVNGADKTFMIEENIAAERLFAQTGAIYLVRPGHHINGRWMTYRENAITQTFQQFLQAAEGAAA